MGSAFYGWLRHTGGKRIGGGIPRSYYVGIHGNQEEAPARRNVLCVVPQHLEEGQEVTMAQPELELALGQPVVFPLFTSTVRGEDKPGDVLAVSGDQLASLPPLHTVLRGGKRAGTKHVPVTLAARLSAIGTMELFCVAKEGNNRWKLEFNIREVVKEEVRQEDEADTPGVAEVWLESEVEQAGEAIRRVYQGVPPPLTPQDLPKALLEVGAGGDALGVAAEPVPAAVGLPRGSRRAADLAGAPEPVVQPRRPLASVPASATRSTGTASSRLVEDPRRPAARALRAANVSRGPVEGGGGLLDHVASRLGRPQRERCSRQLFEPGLRGTAHPGEGQNERPAAGGERTHRDVARRREPRTAWRCITRRRWATRCIEGRSRAARCRPTASGR